MEARERPIALQIGELVRSARDAHGWSQAELAERLELSVDHVGLIERGERMPSVGTLVDVAHELKLSFDALLGEGTDDPWVDEAVGLLRAVPTNIRSVVMAMLKAAVASDEPVRPATRTDRRGR